MKRNYLFLLLMTFIFYAVTFSSVPAEETLSTGHDKKEEEKYYVQMCYRKEMISTYPLQNRKEKIADSNPVKSQYNLVFNYIEAGQDEKAIEILNQAISNNSDKVKASYLLGIIYAKNNREKDAIKTLKKVTELSPKYPEAHYALGLVYLSENKKKAFDEYKILLELDEKLASLLFEFIFN